MLKLITAGQVELGSPDAEEHRANRSQRSRRVGPGYIAAMQDTTWQALLSLVGTWEGDGTIEYPTMDPLVYREVLEIREGRNGPFLHYLQQTWRRDGGKEVGSHHESGFITPTDDGTVRILNAQGTDRVEILQGEVSSAAGMIRIELTSVAIAGDDRMIRSWRNLEIHEDQLAYTMGMTTTQVPDGAIHLTAELSRR